MWSVETKSFEKKNLEKYTPDNIFNDDEAALFIGAFPLKHKLKKKR